MSKNVVLVQLMIFAVISVSIVAYTIFGVVGADPTSDPVMVTMELQTGGGVFEGSEVAFRGVEVGRVDAVHLQRAGVSVTLRIDEGTRIPVDSIANVYDLSVAGEQYVDLVPRHVGGASLRSGDVIPSERTTTPVTTPTVLLDVEQLVNSINPADIRTVSTELARAFAGAGPELRQILDSGSTIVRQLAQSKASMIDLLHSGRIVLDTVAQHSQDFRTFADSLQSLTSTLKSSTPAIESLISAAPAQTRLLDAVVRENGSAAAVLMGNLVTFGGIQVANIPGFRALLVAVPQFGRLLPTVVRGGTLHAAALYNYDEQVCPTGVPLTSPLSNVRSPVYRAGCAEPDLIPRGAANAPPPLGGSTAGGSSASATPVPLAARTTSAGRAQVSTYDPVGGLTATPGGGSIRLGSTGGQDELFGSTAWKTLLLPIGAPQ